MTTNASITEQKNETEMKNNLALIGKNPETEVSLYTDYTTLYLTNGKETEEYTFTETTANELAEKYEMSGCAIVDEDFDSLLGEIYSRNK